MKDITDILNEELSTKAFTNQSVIFDSIYAGNTVVLYKRERVRDHVDQYLQPKSKILELNAGTGEDAIYFASRSHHVHATDISEGMLRQLACKVKKNDLEECISIEQ